MFVSPQNSWCWYLEVGSLGGQALMNGISAFMKETPDNSLALSTMREYSNKIASYV